MADMSYSSSVAKSIKSFLEGDDWHFSFDEEKGTFSFTLSMKNQMKKINYIISVKDSFYTVYAIAPIGADSADSEGMLKMAEFICRANYGLRRGNFELDMRDGEIRYKYFVDFDDATLSQKAIKNSIYTPASMFIRYAPGIMSVIFGGAEAKDAVEKCEQSQD